MEIGKTHTIETVVDKTNVASAIGSGLVDVFATPMMVALMEGAAAACIGPDLQEGFTSVGGYIATSHVAATPIGCTVKATATITAATDKKVDFTVTAHDEAGLIGEGTHTRFIVNEEKFMARLESKKPQ